MATVIEMRADIVRAKAYLASSTHEDILKVQFGICNDCGCNCNEYNLYLVTESLEIRLDNNLLDEITDQLHECLLLKIGKYIVQYGPVVSVGADRIVNIGSTIQISATIIPGTSIIDSILWSQISGPNTALLTNKTTATVTVSNLIEGSYFLKVLVTDHNNLQAFDTIIIKVANEVIVSNVFTSNIYVSSAVRISDTDVIIPELIGCNPDYLVAHRGIGTDLKGTIVAPTGDTVKINPVNGQVTFFDAFSDFEETLWFEYKRDI